MRSWCSSWARQLAPSGYVQLPLPVIASGLLAVQAPAPVLGVVRVPPMSTEPDTFRLPLVPMPPCVPVVVGGVVDMSVLLCEL